MRSRIRSSEKAPISPGSCRWMSIGLPWRDARANSASRQRTGSRSIAQGSMPPTIGTIPQSDVHQRLGPWAVCQAGLRERDNLHVDRIGHCGTCPYRRMHMLEADVGVNIGMRPMRVVPLARKARASASDRAAAWSLEAARQARSFSIRSRRVGPTSLGFRLRPKPTCPGGYGHRSDRAREVRHLLLAPQRPTARRESDRSQQSGHHARAHPRMRRQVGGHDGSIDGTLNSPKLRTRHHGNLLKNSATVEWS